MVDKVVDCVYGKGVPQEKLKSFIELVKVRKQKYKIKMDLSPNQEFPVTNVWISGVQHGNLHLRMTDTGIEFFEKTDSKKYRKYFYYFSPISGRVTLPQINDTETEMSFEDDVSTRIRINFGNNLSALEFVRKHVVDLMTQLDTSSISSGDSWSLSPTPELPKLTESDLLSDDLGKLLETNIHSDVVLVANDGTELGAHKNILSCRSSVFDAMFRSTMEESKKNRVEVQDHDGETLKGLLKFIYTGKVDNLDEKARDLLPASDKYDVKGLKGLCVDNLLSKLTVESVSSALVLGHLHSCTQLKAETLDFITNHATDVMKTDDWKSMAVSFPALINEVALELGKVLASQIPKLGPPIKRIKRD